MKHQLFIGILFILALSACAKVPEPVEVKVPELVEGPTSELSAIDSLMWQQPDSALTLLQDYLTRRDVSRNVSNDNDMHGDVSGNVSTDNDTHGDVSGNVSTDAYENHYAQLLVAELLYKNDYAQTNRAELQQAVAYFDTLLSDTRGVSLRKIVRRDASHASAQNDALVFLAARAHYINGVGYYEQDSIVPACAEYLKALETMEDHFSEEDLTGHKARFMALAYTRLTDLFSNMYLHEQAIYFGKLALEYYYKQEASPRHVAWMLDEIGSHYQMMGHLDSADFYYHNGLTALPDTNTLMYRDIATHLAYLNYNYNKEGTPQTSLEQLYKLLGQSETEKETLSRYSLVGEIYYHENMFDSAWIYLNKVFHESQNIAIRKQVAEWLVEICKASGRDTDILEYANFLVPFANQEENKSEIKSRLTEYYMNYEKRKTEIRYQNQERQSQKTTNEAIGLLILVIATIAILYLATKKRHKHLQIQHEEANANLFHFMQQNKELVESNMAHERKVLDTTQQLSDVLYARLMAMQKLDYCLKTPKDKIALKDLEREVFGTGDHWEAVREVLAALYPGLEETLRLKYPEMDEMELRVCMLSRLKLSRLGEATLLGISVSVLDKLRMKIRRMTEE